MFMGLALIDISTSYFNDFNTIPLYYVHLFFFETKIVLMLLAGSLTSSCLSLL